EPTPVAPSRRVSSADVTRRPPLHPDRRLSFDSAPSAIVSGMRPFFASRTQQASFQFVVGHFAGKVMYDLDAFMQKNQDALPAEAVVLCQGSTSSIVQALLTPPVKKGAKAKLARAPSALRTASVSAQFRSQLDELIAVIGSTQARYIRCVKSNDAGQPRLLHKPRVVQQLRSGGVLEAVRIARAGYAVREDHDHFVDAFGFLVPSPKKKRSTLGGHGDRKQRCEHVVAAALLALEAPDAALATTVLTGGKYTRADLQDACGRAGFQLGYSKIFFRKEVHNQLRWLRRQKLTASSLTLQRLWRGHVARVDAGRRRDAIAAVQRWAKAALATKRHRAAGATIIQAAFRRHAAQRKFATLRRGTAACQRFWRSRRVWLAARAERDARRAAEAASAEGQRRAQLLALQRDREAMEAAARAERAALAAERDRQRQADAAARREWEREQAAQREALEKERQALRDDLEKERRLRDAAVVSRPKTPRAASPRHQPSPPLAAGDMGHALRALGIAPPSAANGEVADNYAQCLQALSVVVEQPMVIQALTQILQVPPPVVDVAPPAKASSVEAVDVIKPTPVLTPEMVEVDLVEPAAAAPDNTLLPAALEPLHPVLDTVKEVYDYSMSYGVVRFLVTKIQDKATSRLSTILTNPTVQTALLTAHSLTATAWHAACEYYPLATQVSSDLERLRAAVLSRACVPLSAAAMPLDEMLVHSPEVRHSLIELALEQEARIKELEAAVAENASFFNQMASAMAHRPQRALPGPDLPAALTVPRE
ncbi:myosin-like protein, partial [Achlya hypogyna]